jgi:hypothetical protein
MSIFLSDRELGPAIKELMKGTGLRCAVAFWGHGAAYNLFGDEPLAYGTKIICDLTMGGTNPGELKALGSPENENLKHLPGLHAKVYISDQGLILCSANASNNGIGFLSFAQLCEAGSFHNPKTDTYIDAVRWFDEIWKKAEVIDDLALEKALNSWLRRTPVHPKGLPLLDTSLLDSVFKYPDQFRGIGFVFTSATSRIKDRDETASVLIQKSRENMIPSLSRAEQNQLKIWPIGDVFGEWPADDVRRWPESFISIHRGPRSGKISYIMYERAYTNTLDKKGCVFGYRSRSLRYALNTGKNMREMAARDNENASHIFSYIEKTDHAMFVDGEELSKLLMTLPPWR